MSEREEHEEQLVDDIEVGHIEVVLQRGEVDPSVDLWYHQSAINATAMRKMPMPSEDCITYVLL